MGGEGGMGLERYKGDGALLRNSLGLGLNRNELQTQSSGDILQAPELSVFVLLLVLLKTQPYIFLAVLDQTVDEPRQFVGGGRDPLGGSQPPLHPAIISAQSTLAALQRSRRQSEGVTEAIDYSPSPAAQHFAAADSVIGTKA